MKVFDILRENIMVVFIILLHILCFITRRFSKPFYSFPLKELDSNSFFGNTELFIKNNYTKEKIYNIEENNNTRLFIKDKYDKTIFYFTFSKYKYYEDYNSSFDFTLHINKSNLMNDDYSIYYLEYFENKSNIIYLKENINIIKNIFSTKNNIPCNGIFINYNKSETKMEFTLSFDDFDLIMNLKRERFTYKFYYLLECIIDTLIHTSLIGSTFWKENYQSISKIFLYFFLAKVNSVSFFHLFDLLQVGLPILKVLFFYSHNLIYGEFLFSISDLISILLTIWIILIIITWILLLKDIELNYTYCFSNKIEDKKIVIRNVKKRSNYVMLSIFLSLGLLWEFAFSKSVYWNSFALIIVIISTILKYLFQRDIMSKKDINFAVNLYSISLAIYLYFLFMYNFSELYRRKPVYAVIPFILILSLFIILLFVIKKGYKFKYVMNKDFERIKKLEKDCCSICLKDYIYNKDNVGIVFCKVTQDENIHETKCHHYFHEKCIFNWRKNRNICPICKARLTIPEFYFFYDDTPCIYKPAWLD